MKDEPAALCKDILEIGANGVDPEFRHAARAMKTAGDIAGPLPVAELERGELDVVLVPGGMGTRTEVRNPVLIDWLRTVSAGSDWVTSVCTGSLLLHEAGPGRGRKLCTHWGFEDALEARGDCTIVRDQRWVADGNVVSSQGVSAGIDMALWLVGQIVSPEHARTTQRYIQYDPAPPYGD